MNKKKVFWKIILVISILVLIGSAYYIFKYYRSGTGDGYEKMTLDPNQQTSQIIDDGVERVENHNIDWQAYFDTNKDVYSWIYVPGTADDDVIGVDYPVLQDKHDDSFYLSHNLYREYEFAGSIYSEMKNAKDYSDPVTVLYGHNMNNKSMFNTLHKFEDPTFFKKHKYMYVYMPQRRLTYKIYAAYVYDDRHILNSFDFSNEEIRMDYFDDTLNPESLTKNTRPVKLTKDSKILTLSTCTNGASNTRYLVQGVLIKDEPTY